MNKEIEETRKKQEQQKQLISYMETIQVQLRDRGLYFLFAVADKQTGILVAGMEGKSSYLAPMVTDIVGRVTAALARDVADTRRKLREDGETWSSE